MSEMSLVQAQLFRVLSGFFGRDRVVWNMSVRTVCGDSSPRATKDSNMGLGAWAGAAGCLFTVVDDNDLPKMVVEFELDTTDSVDLLLLERQQRLPKLLESCGIRYIVLTQSEFGEILDPDSPLDLVSLLQERLNLTGDDDEVES